MKKENYLKNSNGITLMALVITVIVLIILAGVSIAAVRNNNGVASKAKQASTTSMQKQEEEILQQAITKALKNSAYGSIEQEDLNSAIKDFADGQSYTVNSTGNTSGALMVRFSKTGSTYVVAANGEYAKSR